MTPAGWARSALVFAVVSLALVVTGANFAKHQDVLAAVAAEAEHGKAQTLSAGWSSCGVAYTLATPRHLGETLGDWGGRHRDALQSITIRFPVDPPPPPHPNLAPRGPGR